MEISGAKCCTGIFDLSHRYTLLVSFPRVPPSLQTMITDLRSRIAHKLAKAARKASHMTPAEALAEFSEPLRLWEASLRPRCHTDAGALRTLRMNIQTAAGSGFSVESFGITLAEDLLDARTRLLGENEAWRKFTDRVERNLPKVAAKSHNFGRRSPSSSPPRSEHRRQTPPAPRKSNHDRPSGKNLYKFLQRVVGSKVKKGDCFICAFLERPQRGAHDFKACRFYAEGLETARKRSDYSDRG